MFSAQFGASRLTFKEAIYLLIKIDKKSKTNIGQGV